MTKKILDWNSVSQALGMDPVSGTCTKHPTCSLVFVEAPTDSAATLDADGTTLLPEVRVPRIQICRICDSEFLALVTSAMGSGTGTEVPADPTGTSSSPTSSSAQVWWASRQQRKSMAPSIHAIQTIHAMPEWKEFTERLDRNGEGQAGCPTVEQSSNVEEGTTTTPDPPLGTTMNSILQQIDPLELIQQALMRNQQLHDWESIQNDLTIADLRRQVSALQKERDEQAALIESLHSKIERQQQTIAKELKMIKTIAKKRANTRTAAPSSGGGLSGAMSDAIAPMTEAPPKLPDRKVSSDVVIDLIPSYHRREQEGGDSWNHSSATLGSEREPPPPPFVTSPPGAPPIMPVRQTTKEPMVLTGTTLPPPPPPPPTPSQHGHHYRFSGLESPPMKPVRLVSHDKLLSDPKPAVRPSPVGEPSSSDSSHNHPRPPSPVRAESSHSSGARKGQRGIPLSPNTKVAKNGIANNIADNSTRVSGAATASVDLTGRNLDANRGGYSPSTKGKEADPQQKSTDDDGDSDSSSASSSSSSSSSSSGGDSSSEASSRSSSMSSSSSSASSLGALSDQQVLEFTPPPPFDRKSIQKRASVAGSNSNVGSGKRQLSIASNKDEKSSRVSSNNNLTNLERGQSKEIAFVPTAMESQEAFVRPGSFDLGEQGNHTSVRQNKRNQSPAPLTTRTSVTEYEFHESQQLLRDASLALSGGVVATPPSKLRKSLPKKGSASDVSPVARRQVAISPTRGRPSDQSPVPRAGRRGYKGAHSPTVHSPQPREQQHPDQQQPRRNSAGSGRQYKQPQEKQQRRCSTSNVVQPSSTPEKQQRRAPSLENLTPLERHLAVSNSPYQCRTSSFQSEQKINLATTAAISQLDSPPFLDERIASFRPIAAYQNENEEEEVDDELGDLFDDGAAGLPLGDYLKLGDFLEVQRSGNLSPVSALTTGSYLKEQALAAQADNEIQPRKALQNAEFSKKLPLEDEFDSDEEETESLVPRSTRAAPQNKDASKSADGEVPHELGTRAAAAPAGTPPSGTPPATAQRKLSKSTKSPTVRQKNSNNMETLDDLPLASEGVKNIPSKPRMDQQLTEQGQSRKRSSKRSSKPVRQVDGETISDKYGEQGLYTGAVTIDAELPHGYGEMKYFNDRQYAGDWKSGRWHGMGRWSNPNGDVYEGSFDYDARHGAGVYKWKNGNCYEGEFYEDKRQGKGTFHFANGNEYVGEFINGVFEGNGKYLFDGGEYNGTWVSGRYHGSGTLIFHNGTSYKGEFADGVAHGKGEETTTDGTVRRGIWDQGRPQR